MQKCYASRNLICKLLVEKMERAKGFEPSTQNSQTAQPQSDSQTSESGYTQIRAQILRPHEPDLAQVVESWPKLSQPLKSAIISIVAASKEESGVQAP